MLRVVQFSIRSILFIFSTSSVFSMFSQTFEKQFIKFVKQKYNIEFCVLLWE